MTNSEMVLYKLQEYTPKAGLDQTLRTVLSLMGVRHAPVLHHMERVALLCEATAIEMEMDAKAAFLAGLAHDAGKMLLPDPLFAGQNITEDEYALVKEHAKNGHDALRKMHPFVALAMGLHHAVYKNGYGITVADFPQDWGVDTISKVLRISVLVSICDFIDAFMHRRTDIKDGSDSGPNLQQMLYDKYPEDHMLCDAALAAYENNEHLHPQAVSA